MARAALVALTWAAAVAAASAVRYVDYVGVKMPHYGPGDYEIAHEPAQMVAGAEDYHGRSPDASASLDYKFEDDARGEFKGKSERPLKVTDDRDSRSEFARRHRKLDRFHDDEMIYDPESESITREKLNRRSLVHRPRLKNSKSRKDNSPHKRLIKYSRGKSDPVDPDMDDFELNSDGIPEDSSKEIDDVLDGYEHTQATERIIRRKPRDRVMRERMMDGGDARDNVLEPNRRIKPEGRTDPDYGLQDEDRPRINDQWKQAPFRPVMTPIEEANIQSKQKSNAHDNYGDYYDMKRVQNIKNKLPVLLRRSSARVKPPTVTSISNDLDAIWTRQSTVPSPPVPALGALSVVPLPSLSVITDRTASTEVSRRVATPNASEEMSLAEKSRLSILKKAQRKESVRSNTSTLKPPVLLQVTDKRLTVVVVEPPSSEGPWMRAREVTLDTPERVDRAKRLMRHKLVAKAKNIQELTDNWDDMICDYIDVSLLDGQPRQSTLSTAAALLVGLMFVL